MEQAGTVVRQQALTPIMDFGQAKARYKAMVDFATDIMRDGVDYGKVPGVAKPSLMKPGAEKLTAFFGLSPRFILEQSIEDWTGAEHGGEPLFYYRYRCILTRDGITHGEGEGSANSWETKYRYRWVSESDVPSGVDTKRLQSRQSSAFEYEFALKRRETSGRYGKPQGYWDHFEAEISANRARKVEKEVNGRPAVGWEIASVVYRIPNAEICDQINTLQKMAQKRALIAATLIACNASEYFTQDLEDLHSSMASLGDEPYSPITEQSADANKTQPTTEAKTQSKEDPKGKAQPAAQGSQGDRMASMHRELDALAKRVAALGPEAAELIDNMLSEAGASGEDENPFAWVKNVTLGKALYKRMSEAGTRISAQKKTVDAKAEVVS